MLSNVQRKSHQLQFILHLNPFLTERLFGCKSFDEFVSRIILLFLFRRNITPLFSFHPYPLSNSPTPIHSPTLIPLSSFQLSHPYPLSIFPTPITFPTLIPLSPFQLSQPYTLSESLTPTLFPTFPSQ